MLHFVIPLRASVTSNDWGQTGRLLERTIESAARQKGGSVRVWVVCHERPDGIHVPDAVTWLPAPFPPPDPSSAGGDVARLVRLYRSDKGRKLLFGLEHVREYRDAYAMFLDADDLVSCRLGEYVACHSGGNGWYINRGYRWDDDSPRWLIPRRRFHHECGSSYILRADRAPFPEHVDYSRDFGDYYVRRYVVHAYIADAMARLGHPLRALPFPGAVYCFHQQNIYARTFRGPDAAWKRAARILLKGRFANSAIKAEFGLRMCENVDIAGGTPHSDL